MNVLRMLTWIVGAVLLLTGAAPATASPGAGLDFISGRWNAALGIPAGDVEFELDLTLHGSDVRGSLRNGSDRIDFTGGSFDGTTLTLKLDYYDGQIVARFDGADRSTLTGEYSRQTRSGVGRYTFKATKASVVGEPKIGAPVGSALDISGDWVMTILDGEGKVDEVDDLVFSLGPGTAERAWLSGTMIPVSGDSGLLSGTITHVAEAAPGQKSVRFKICRFDGIHVMLLTGELQPDGSLKGETASGQSYRAPWTAVRKNVIAENGAAPPDPYTLTTVKDPTEAFAFSLPDTAGKTVSLTDPRFKGKVVLIDIFGTWCPNCHDAAPFLSEMYKKYHDKGLEIVGLAYEYTSDTSRNARQIEIYRKKYAIEFPLLMAGTTNDGEIARTLPQLVNFGAYPTTIFVGRDGRVKKIHAGFSGPATGKRFDVVKHEWEEHIRELLDEPAGE